MRMQGRSGGAVVDERGMEVVVLEEDVARRVCDKVANVYAKDGGDEEVEEWL
jgi:hypothetical protein